MSYTYAQKKRTPAQTDARSGGVAAENAAASSTRDQAERDEDSVFISNGET